MLGAGTNGLVIRRETGELRGSGQALSQGLLRREDGEASDEWTRCALRGGEVACGKMKARKCLPGRVRMGGALERRPGDCVLIKIDAGWDCVKFIGAIADPNGGLA